MLSRKQIKGWRTNYQNVNVLLNIFTRSCTMSAKKNIYNLDDKDKQLRPCQVFYSQQNSTQWYLINQEMEIKANLKIFHFLIQREEVNLRHRYFPFFQAYLTTLEDRRMKTKRAGSYKQNVIMRLNSSRTLLPNYQMLKTSESLSTTKHTIMIIFCRRKSNKT